MFFCDIFLRLLIIFIIFYKIYKSFKYNLLLKNYNKKNMCHDALATWVQ
jgi:hypothetical protein